MLLNGVQLFWPEARKWMWDYCIYLGPYIDSEGHEYDLGIFVQTSTGEVSHAIVFGNEPGDYMSGDLKSFTYRECHKENIERAKRLRLYDEGRAYEI